MRKYTELNKGHLFISDLVVTRNNDKIEFNICRKASKCNKLTVIFNVVNIIKLLVYFRSSFFF